MWCPKCDGEARTIDSRKYRDVSQLFEFVRRSRICRACGHKFVTIEVTQPIWENYYNPRKKIYKEEEND